MNKTIPSSFEQTTPTHFKKFSSGGRIICLLIVFIPALIVFSLPFIYVDISVRVPGIIRPAMERAVIRPAIAGIVAKVFVQEGQFVRKGTLLLALNDTVAVNKRLSLSREIKGREEWFGDLNLLVKSINKKSIHSPNLKTTLYRQQWDQYNSQRLEWLYRLQKLEGELHIHQELVQERIITPKEMADKKLEYKSTATSLRAFELAQVNTWLSIADKYLIELERLKLQDHLYREEESLAHIRSPVSGRVQYIQDKYPGTMVSAGEMICSLSPDSMMIAECWISANDIGLLTIGQFSIARVHAFNYNYFGTVPGRIISIDDDFTLMDNKPMFKVKCSVQTYQLRLKNGYTGKLKKGMTLDMRFITARRSLWQLLYDQADDWLNPSAPEK